MIVLKPTCFLLQRESEYGIWANDKVDLAPLRTNERALILVTLSSHHNTSIQSVPVYRPRVTVKGMFRVLL